MQWNVISPSYALLHEVGGRSLPSDWFLYFMFSIVLWINISFQHKRKISKGTKVPSHLFSHVVSALTNLFLYSAILCSSKCEAALGAYQSIKSYPKAWHQEHCPALCHKYNKLKWARHFSSATFLKFTISFWKQCGSETSQSKQMTAVNKHTLLKGYSLTFNMKIRI